MTILIVLTLMFILLLSGLPVSFSLGFLGLAMLIFGGFSPLMAPQAILSTLDGFILLAVPLFLLMSNVLLKGGCGKDLFNAVQAWVGHWPGGLAVATIISCGIFSAISGVSVATAATIGVVAIPEMINSGQGGSIINIGSTSSFLGNPLRSSYAASKWGLIGLTKTWAMEYGKDNIRVNTVCPSSINGQRIKNVIKKEAEYRNSTPEKIKSTYLNQTSLKKFIDAEEVIGMIVYLLSPLAKKISGQMLVIDGHTESLAMEEF